MTEEVENPGNPLIDQMHVLRLARFTGLLDGVVLVIVRPTSDVLISDDAMGLVVLVQHGEESMPRGRRFGMHDLLKIGVAAIIVAQESTGSHW